MTTTSEIKAELTNQLQVLFKYGNVKAVFGSLEQVPANALHMCIDSSIPFDLTLTGNAEQGFVVYVNRIGDTTVLDGLPHLVVDGELDIPDHVFLSSDDFHFEYRHSPRVRNNYNIYPFICSRLQPASIFEIGVRAGYSAWALLKNCPTALYHGIDLDAGTSGGKIGYTEHAKRMLPQCYPKAKLKIEYADSQMLVELPQHYDLIHIDGDHGHDDTLSDLILCSRHTDNLLIDDVTHISTVGSAVTEFLGLHPVPATYYDTWRGHVLLDTSSL